MAVIWVLNRMLKDQLFRKPAINIPLAASDDRFHIDFFQPPFFPLWGGDTSRPHYPECVQAICFTRCRIYCLHCLVVAFPIWNKWYFRRLWTVFRQSIIRNSDLLRLRTSFDLLSEQKDMESYQRYIIISNDLMSLSSLLRQSNTGLETN